MLVESAPGRLELHTRKRIWWPGPLWMTGLLGAAGFGLFQFFTQEPRRPWTDLVGAFFAVLILEGIFAALTVWLSTHQWMRLAQGGIEVQSRLASKILSSKRASLAEIQGLVSETVENNEMANTNFLIIKTARWEYRFGSGSDSETIDELKALILRVPGVSLEA